MSKVDISELDLADANDLLTELNGKPSKEKKVAEARAKLTAALVAKGMDLSTDDEGNFVLEASKPAKGKAKAAPEPDEDEDEAPPPPKKSAKPAKAKAAPEPDEDEDEDEDEEVAPPAKKKTKPAADGVKRAPPPRDPKYAPTQKIKILEKDVSFRPDSGRAKKWDIMLASKTVGAFLESAREAELATPSSYLAMCVKTGKISVT